MKQLRYRSIDSMLKRENIAELFAAIRFIESSQWQEKFIKAYKKLKPSDFEIREIEILQLSAKRWGDSANQYMLEHRHNITHLKEFGVIAVLPMPVETMPGLTLTVLPLLLHYINEIRLYSAFFKLQQVKPHFGDVIARVIHDDAADTAQIAGQPIHWRMIRQHFGKRRRLHPEVFEPHVQPDDLYYKKAESVLYRLEPALKFWEDLDYVAQQTTKGTISFNLLDNAVNYCNSLDYGQQTSFHLQQSIWNELMARYLGQENLEQQVLSQLADELIETKTKKAA